MSRHPHHREHGSAATDHHQPPQTIRFEINIQD
jgi:hypothetical protein